jgi:hypothetical protein
MEPTSTGGRSPADHRFWSLRMPGLLALREDRWRPDNGARLIGRSCRHIRGPIRPPATSADQSNLIGEVPAWRADGL